MGFVINFNVLGISLIVRDHLRKPDECSRKDSMKIFGVTWVNIAWASLDQYLGYSDE
jgi:hypothetical protein